MRTLLVCLTLCPGLGKRVIAQMVSQRHTLQALQASQALQALQALQASQVSVSLNLPLRLAMASTTSAMAAWCGTCRQAGSVGVGAGSVGVGEEKMKAHQPQTESNTMANHNIKAHTRATHARTHAHAIHTN